MTIYPTGPICTVGKLRPGRVEVEKDRQYTEQIPDCYSELTAIEKKQLQQAIQKELGMNPDEFQQLCHRFSDLQAVKPVDPSTGYKNVMVDTQKLDQLLRDSTTYWNYPYRGHGYITPGGKNGVIEDRYYRFINWLKNEGKSELLRPSFVAIEQSSPTTSVLQIGVSGFSIGVMDGRHRLAIFRDMGLPQVPIRIHKDSEYLLKQAGCL